MTLPIVLVIISAVGILVATGSVRIQLTRIPGLAGIEDPGAAEAYNRISRWPQFNLLRRMIARKLAKRKPSGILADIGCGPGRLVTLIAQENSDLRVLGIDAAEEMIRAAKANAAWLGLSERVDFRKGDVSSLPIPDEALDFAVSTLSLHHWSDPGEGLGEIHRVLKAGGQLMLFDLRRDPRRFFYWLLRFAQAFVVPGALRQVKEPLGSILSSYTLAELQAILRGTPFKEWTTEEGVGWVLIWARKS